MMLRRIATKKPGAAADEYNDPPRPFIEHLIELRDCLLRCAVAWAFCSVGIIPLAPKLLFWIREPAGQYQDLFQGLELTSGIDMILKVMLWGGTVIALPFLIFFLLRFVFPGLKRSERVMILFILLTSTVLFIGGVWVAYKTTLQVAIKVLMQVNNWMGFDPPLLRIDQYVGFVVKLVLGFGLAFQLPLLLLILGWLGMVSSGMLREKRRLAIVVIFILAMVLTPPDPMSQIIMAVPMCLMYELCIWLIRVREITRGKRGDEPGAAKTEERG
jgi:sec-independent protein translocase protein TatC